MRLRYLLAFLLITCNLAAREPYHAKVTVEGVSQRVSDPNLLDLTRSLKTTSLELLIPLYTPTSPVSIGINLRGILAETSFAANSNTLNVIIPQANISTSFTGSTRDESLKLFKEFIRDGGNRHHLLKAYQRYSPIDPIAGNPNSLLALMGQADYLLGRLTPLAGCDCGSAQPIPHLFEVNAQFTRGFSKGFETTAVSAPLRYSYSPYGDWAFILDAPFTYLRNGGASSLTGSIGLGFRLPLFTQWSLTPIFRLGSGGSLDLCTAGNFASFGIDSNYDLPLGAYVLSMTNYAGYVTSANFWLSGINFNYRLQTYLFKNGLTLASCEGFTLWERPFNFNLYVIDTAFSKKRLFISHYDEVGISVNTSYLNRCLEYDLLSVGLSYTFGEQSYHGWTLTASYQF